MGLVKYLSILYVSFIVEIQYQSNREVLDFLSYRESRNTLSAVGYNNNGTRDYGLYQLNDITFAEMQQRGYNTPQMDEFLRCEITQKYYANLLLHIHKSILLTNNIPLTKSNLIKSWSGVYNFRQYE